MIDVTMSALLLLTLPISVWFVKDRGGFVSNAWSVLLGRKSWVGYQAGGERALKLPGIKPGVLGTLANEVVTDQAVVACANTAYAKDYSPWRDLSLVVRGFRALGGA